VAKVADFGLSLRMDPSDTHVSGMFQGTMTHMAPEAMLAGKLSRASDVYAYGILLWELYGCGHAFRGVPRALLGHEVAHKHSRPTFSEDCPFDYQLLACRWVVKARPGRWWPSVQGCGGWCLSNEPVVNRMQQLCSLSKLMQPFPPCLPLAHHTLFTQGPFCGLSRYNLGHISVHPACNLTLFCHPPRIPAPLTPPVLSRCWETDPSIRPSFQDILMELRRMRARHKAANPIRGAWRRSRTTLEHSVSGHALAGSDNDLAAAAAAAAAAAEAGGRPPGSPVAAAVERPGRASQQLAGEWDGSRSGEGPGPTAGGLTPAAAAHPVGRSTS
jgi:serine/threonine protein kinase